MLGDAEDPFLKLLDDLLRDLETSQNDVDAKHVCLKDLAAISKQIGPAWSIRPFGSAANGFCTRLSDLDVTCFEDAPNGKSTSAISAVDAMMQMHPLLQNHPSFVVNELISSARIPIMKIRFGKTLDVDLSFQNTEPLPNTQLLRAYAKMSPTVRQLGIIVKLWASAEGVCGAQDGHLSSYSFIIMVLYFLQVDEYVKMPCFPTSEFTGQKSSPECANVKWTCNLPLASLISRFFEFYATMHCWGYEVISPRVGQRLYTSDAVFANLVGRKNTAMIHIEDPILCSRNLNCVLGQMQQGYLYNKINQTHMELAAGNIPNGFLSAQLSCRRHAINNVLNVLPARCERLEQLEKTGDAKSIAKANKANKELALSAPNGHGFAPAVRRMDTASSGKEQQVKPERPKRGASLHESLVKYTNPLNIRATTREFSNPLNIPATTLDASKLTQPQRSKSNEGPPPDTLPGTYLRVGGRKDKIIDGMTWSL